MYQKITLKNGMRIITVPQNSTQAVTVLVLVATGSKYENKKINGLSHFLEHMFFKGTSKRPDKLDIAETLDKIGGIYNAFTGEDYTGYFAKVAAEKFELALDWVSDIYLNSLLPEREVKREKGVIIEEINMLYDAPMSRVGLLWNHLLYGDQPAGWDIAGTKESVSSITRKNLADYMKSQYVAGNTIVCVAGKIDGEETIKKIRQYFSKISAAVPVDKSKVIEKQAKPAVLLDYRKTDQTHLCFGARGYNIFHPHKYAQDVLGVILGGMMSSRLFIEIREKLGIAYYVKSSAEANPDTGFLASQAGVDNRNAERAVATIMREYRRITKEKVPAAELQKAKDHIKGKMALLLEPSDELAAFYGLQELMEKHVLSLKEVYNKIDEVSQKDILQVAKNIFQPKNINLAMVGPFKNKKIFENILIK